MRVRVNHERAARRPAGCAGLAAAALLIACSSPKQAADPVVDEGNFAAGGGGTATAPGSARAGSGGSAANASTSGRGGGAGTSAGGASGASGTSAAGAGAGVAGTAPDPDGGAPVGMARGTGPGDYRPGDYPPGLEEETYLEISGVAGQGDYVRQYKVHVPPGYDPNVPTPAVFCIHGLGQTAVLFCVTGAAMHTKSDQAGFILIMPNGYSNSWNAGTCCGAASDEQLDEVALFRAIFAEVGKHVNIDLDRVYATGLSNGGYMSFRLACEAADIFTAVAPGAAALGINEIGGGTNPASNFVACMPSRPVSLLQIHGTADPLIPYSLQQPSLALMAMRNGCATTTRPATMPASAGDTKCVSYDGCPAGIELTGCTIEEGGHCWFGSPDCGTGGGDIGLAIVGNNSDTMRNTDAAWSFFAARSR